MQSLSRIGRRILSTTFNCILWIWEIPRKLRGGGAGKQTLSRDLEESALAGFGPSHQRRGTHEKIPMRRAPFRTVEDLVR